MTSQLSVALMATTAAWSASLRSYLRDHTQGVRAQVVASRAALMPLIGELDVLVIDDVMRSLSGADLAVIVANGVTVIGVFDPVDGLGSDYLSRLGATEVLPATAAVGELVARITRVEARPKKGLVPGNVPDRDDRVRHAPERTDGQRATLSMWTKVTGGAGLTETVAAAADLLSSRARVLLLELDELAPVMAARLLRSPDSGLAWALSRAAQGQSVVPEALSGPRDDGLAPLGRFDAICVGHGPAQLTSAHQVDKLLQDVEHHYDHVLVEAVTHGTPGQSPWCARLLQRADRVTVLSSSDPEGAGRLVEWKAATVELRGAAQCGAVFGRATTSRYERARLVGLVEDSTGASPYDDIWFLPEDATVRRARWNGEMVWKGPWLKAVRSLAESAHASRGARP